MTPDLRQDNTRYLVGGGRTKRRAKVVNGMEKKIHDRFTTAKYLLRTIYTTGTQQHIYILQSDLSFQPFGLDNSRAIKHMT